MNLIPIFVRSHLIFPEREGSEIWQTVLFKNHDL